MAVDVESSEMMGALQQLTAQVERIATQLERQNMPVAWYRRPIGYALVGAVFLISAGRDQGMLIPAALFFVCSAIVGTRR